MSEYQHYEFQAIDRPLTEDEQRAVAQLSSRVDPHPRRAVFTYSFGGGLRRGVEDLLAEYYDAMLYLANWGSRQLMFRFPKSLLDLEQMQQYNVVTLDYPSDAVNVYTKGEYAILDIQLHEEEGLGWIEGEGWLDSLVGLRDAILRRDYRLLYLAWLKGVTLAYEADEDALEPPAPPGLGNLTAALDSFVRLFDVDTDLLQVAAERSAQPVQTASTDDLRQAIAQLLPEEKGAFLLRLAQGEPHLSLALNRRLETLRGVSQADTTQRRTVNELFAAAKALRERKRREHAARAEAGRIAELEALARRGEDAWQEIDALIQKSQAKPYDEAVRLLVRLKELALHQGQEAAFQARMARISDQYKRRHSLIKRFRKARLV
ncbi:MAG: hypothetical protein ISS49_03170 [Anaerolineae bacterium]|nr:hypothetical protein [Anaerolineae bacterium]